MANCNMKDHRGTTSASALRVLHIGRHCCSVGASSEEPQATHPRSRSHHGMRAGGRIRQMQVVLSGSLEYAPGFPSPAVFRENRRRTYILLGHFLAACAREFGSEIRSNDSRRLASHLRSRSRFWLPKPISNKMIVQRLKQHPKSPC